MANDTRKVQSGDPLRIPASTWNKMLDLVEGRGVGVPGAGEFGQSPVIVQVKNTTGATVDRFCILTLGNPVIDSGDELTEFQARPNFEGTTPATGDTDVAILLHPLEANAIGPAVVAGVVACKVNVTDAVHNYAEVTNGDATKLTSKAAGPFRILWKDSGTGTKWTYVQLPAIGVGIKNHIACASQLEIDELDGFKITAGTHSVRVDLVEVNLRDIADATYAGFLGQELYGIAKAELTALSGYTSAVWGYYAGVNSGGVHFGGYDPSSENFKPAKLLVNTSSTGTPSYSEGVESASLIYLNATIKSGIVTAVGTPDVETLQVVTDVTYTTSSGYVTSITVTKATIVFLGSVVYSGLPPTTYRIAEPPDPRPAPKPRWIGVDDLARCAVKLASMLPYDITDIVAIPRSGMLVASIIATIRHLPLWTMGPNGPEPVGVGVRGQHSGLDRKSIKRAAVIDDTVYSGAAMAEARKKMAGVDAVYCAAYVRPEGSTAVDIYADSLHDPHILEWNIVNSGQVHPGWSASPFFSGGIALDIDGVVLHDHASGGEPGYPYLVPRWLSVPLLITGRAERDRAITERQLAKAGCRYDRLIMNDNDGPLDDDGIARYKAKHFKDSDCSLFIESCPTQAKLIAEISGKPVACPIAKEVFMP